MKDIAISYAQRGWAVFPLIPNSKKPITAHGLLDASKDTKQITEWWTKWPNANIGICAGEVSGFVVVDIDVKSNAPGLESLKGLNLPPTLTVKTPSGGWHYFYTYGKGLSNRTNLYPGIDFKTEGGYVVGVGSKIDGNAYEWVDESHSIEPLPQIIISAFEVKKTYAQTDEKEQIVLGGRNAKLASMAGSMRRQGMTPEQMLPSLRLVNEQKCRPPLSENEVISIVQSIGRYSPPSDKPAEESLVFKTQQILNEIKRIHMEFEGMGCNEEFYLKAKKTIPKLVEELHLAGENIDLKFEIYKEKGNFAVIDFALKRYREAWSKLLSAS